MVPWESIASISEGVSSNGAPADMLRLRRHCGTQAAQWCAQSALCWCCTTGTRPTDSSHDVRTAVRPTTCTTAPRAQVHMAEIAIAAVGSRPATARARGRGRPDSPDTYYPGIIVVSLNCVPFVFHCSIRWNTKFLACPVLVVVPRGNSTMVPGPGTVFEYTAAQLRSCAAQCGACHTATATGTATGTGNCNCK